MYVNIFSMYFRIPDAGSPKNKRSHIASFRNVLQIKLCPFSIVED